MLICLFHALHGSAVAISCDDKALGVAAYLLTVGIVTAEDGAVARGDYVIDACGIYGDLEGIGLHLLKVNSIDENG